MYYFSAPMPYQKQFIDKLIDINTKVEKAQITSLYGSLPSSCNMYTGFEQARNIQLDYNDFDYWKSLISYSLNKGIDFIYLLNNPNSMPFGSKKLDKQITNLNKLLCELKKIGVTKLRVANPQLMSYLGKYYKDFDIYVSTSLDYKTISEYQNLILMHPEIKQIVPSHDVNKNFQLLKNIKHDYPNLDIEIMVNEGCMKGCPHRIIHENLICDNSQIPCKDLALSHNYCITFCSHISKKYPFHSLTLNNNIYPWEIEEYSKIGINKFKLVGRDAFTNRIESYLKEYLAYFKGIDNLREVEDDSIVIFIHHLLNCKELQQLKTKEIRHLLPKIEHFKKYGHLCASRCGVECRYCYKCAEKIQKVFEKKKKQPHYVPACKMA